MKLRAPSAGSGRLDSDQSRRARLGRATVVSADADVTPALSSGCERQAGRGTWRLVLVLSGRVSADRRPSDSTRPQETGQRASHSDDDLSLGVSLSLVLESHGDLTQLVAAIDDGRERSGLDELLQRNQVLPVVPHEEHAHLLAHER